MLQAIEFIKQQPRQSRKAKKVKKLFEIREDRAEWVEKFSARKGISQVEVIEAGIDELRRLEQEVAQTE